MLYWEMLFLLFVLTVVTANDESRYGLDFEDSWVPLELAEIEDPINEDFHIESDQDVQPIDQLSKRDGMLSYLLLDPETGTTYAPVEVSTKDSYLPSEWPEDDCETSTEPPELMPEVPVPSYPEEPSHGSRPEVPVPPYPEEPSHGSRPEVPVPSYPEEPSNESDYESDSIFVGSIRGTPGVHFPDYVDIPLTSFTCSDKKYMPGFYADLETGCQVFHVCWPHRRESLLCPIGTTFNQAILACDYWYSSNCSLSPHYYDVNAAQTLTGADGASSEANIGSIIDSLVETPTIPGQHPKAKPQSLHPTKSDLSYIMKFLPVKAKVTVYTEGKSKGKTSIVAEASVGKTKKAKPEVVVVPEGPMYPELHTTEEPVTSDYPRPQPSTREPVVTEMPIYPPKKPLPEHVEKVKPVPHEKKTKWHPVHGGIDPSVSKAIDDVFDIAKKIVKEAGGFIPRTKWLVKHHKIPVTHAHKRVPLTKLKPKFIVKPAVVQHPVKAVPVEKHLKEKALPVEGAKLEHVMGFKPVLLPLHNLSVQLKVSPLTKKALTENYLKLWETKVK